MNAPYHPIRICRRYPGDVGAGQPLAGQKAGYEVGDQPGLQA